MARSVLAVFLLFLLTSCKWFSPEVPPPREVVPVPEEERQPKPADVAPVEPLPEQQMPAVYEGEVLAGSTAPLLDFTKADYDRARESQKLIVLYFYANWCPICHREVPHLSGAFNKLTTDQVIGFRVNYNDSETDADEADLARQLGVVYQHTKVFLRNGEKILDSLEGWDEARYLAEIQAAVAR